MGRKIRNNWKQPSCSNKLKGDPSKNKIKLLATVPLSLEIITFVLATNNWYLSILSVSESSKMF